MEMLMTNNSDSMNADRWNANCNPCLFIHDGDDDKSCIKNNAHAKMFGTNVQG